VGSFATFSPFYEQAFEARKAFARFTQIKTFEVIEREMQFGKRGTPPCHTSRSHWIRYDSPSLTAASDCYSTFLLAK